MPTIRTRSNGAYAPLSAYYYQDDRVGDAGPMAELLFLRSLAYCAGKLNDGFMTEQQVRRFVAVGLEEVEDLCKRLVAVGLWDRDDDRDGYQVRNFLKWNRSKDEISSQRARDAARKRAGGGFRGARDEPDDDPDDGLPAESGRNPRGLRPTEQNRTEQIQASGRTPSGPVRPEATHEDTPRPAAKAPDLSPLRQQISAATQKQRAPRGRS